jgi:hypothetical protein
MEKMELQPQLQVQLLIRQILAKVEAAGRLLPAVLEERAALAEQEVMVLLAVAAQATAQRHTQRRESLEVYILELMVLMAPQPVL